MKLKFTKLELIIIAISLVTDFVARIFGSSPTLGTILLTEGVFVIFFSVFIYVIMLYGYSKRGTDAYSPKTMERVKRALPRIVLVFGLLGIIGFILMLIDRQLLLF